MLRCGSPPRAIRKVRLKSSYKRPRLWFRMDQREVRLQCPIVGLRTQRRLSLEFWSATMVRMAPRFVVRRGTTALR